MAEDRFIYQPYRSQRFLIPLIQVVYGLYIFLMGCVAVEKMWTVLAMLTGFAFVLAWTISILQKQLNALILVDAKGIILIGDKKNAYRHISWDALSYWYQASNFKNHQFLILSNEPLTDKQAKSLANRCANHSQMYLDGSLGIYLDPAQDTASLVDHITRHICFPGEKPSV